MTRRFDVVVVGAGPAGLAAAGEAAQRGMHVAIIDDNPRVGGQIWRQGPDTAATRPAAAALALLRRHANVAMLTATRVAAPLPPDLLLLESSGREAAVISYGALVIATGARERLLPLPGWTLPGVTGAGGLQALIKGGLPVRSQRIVIAGSGPLLLAAHASARKAGAEVIAVVEQAPLAAVARFGTTLVRTPSKLRQALQLMHGIPLPRYWTNSVVREVHGDAHVEAVVVERHARRVTLACDRLAVGYGLVPNTSLAQALGCMLANGAVSVGDDQRTSIDGVFAAGECTGIGGAELATIEGHIAGRAASGEAVPARLRAERDRWRRFASSLAQAFALGPRACARPPDETLLCRCEDATFGAVAARQDWRDAKLHTRCGMGACQGRLCGPAAELYFGWDIGAPRPPLGPARIATLIAAAGPTASDSVSDTARDFSSPIISRSSTFQCDA